MDIRGFRNRDRGRRISGLGVRGPSSKMPYTRLAGSQVLGTNNRAALYWMVLPTSFLRADVPFAGTRLMLST